MKIEEILSSLPSREDILHALNGQGRNGATDMTTVLGAFGAGVLLGAGLALLFAPGSGEELRHTLAERLDDVRHHFDKQSDTPGRPAAHAPAA